MYRFRVIECFLSKVANFSPHHLHLSPPWGVIPFEFLHDLCYQKTTVLRLLCGFIFVILLLAVLIQYRSVVDTNTDRQTDRQMDEQTHDDGIYRT